MNIAFVFDGRDIVTPALSGAILHGVTRRSLLQLAPDVGFPVTERRIAISEVLDGLATGRITEIFGMGTGAVIAPVGRLYFEGQEIQVRDGQPGPVAHRLHTELTGLQTGRRPDPYGWTQKILGASRVAMTLYLGPIYTAVIGWLVLGETLGVHHLAGGLLILSGVGLVLAVKQPPPKPA
jgi:hypothetical protein